MSARRPLLAAGAAGALVAIVAVIVLAAVGVFDSGDGGSGRGGLPAVVTARAQILERSAGDNTIRQIYERESPSIFFVQSRVPQGIESGTAWLYDDQGHLITNDHVIAGGGDIALRVGENELVPVTVVGADPSSDLAVLRVDRSKIEDNGPLPLGDSSQAFVGQPVIAIGNPFGLVGTATFGIVSALQRELQSPNGYPIAHAIQTDAPINPGNSGGPLVDFDGKVIGVNSQIATGDSGANQSAGIGFAIPINTVKQVAQELIRDGHVSRAFLGVSTIGVTPDLARQIGLGVDHGAYIVRVASGSPADRAGLRGGGGGLFGGGLVGGGDVIVSVDGQAISGPDDLAQQIGSKKPGATATVMYVRGGSQHTVTVHLSARPQSG